MYFRYYYSHIVDVLKLIFVLEISSTHKRAYLWFILLRPYAHTRTHSGPIHTHACAQASAMSEWSTKSNPKIQIRKAADRLTCSLLMLCAPTTCVYSTERTHTHTLTRARSRSLASNIIALLLRCNLLGASYLWRVYVAAATLVVKRTWIRTVLRLVTFPKINRNKNPYWFHIDYFIHFFFCGISFRYCFCCRFIDSTPRIFRLVAHRHHPIVNFILLYCLFFLLSVCCPIYFWFQSTSGISFYFFCLWKSRVRITMEQSKWTKKQK